MSGLILYTTDGGKSQIQLWADLGAVWLTRLDTTATVKESLTVQTEGARKGQRLAKNLLPQTMTPHQRSTSTAKDTPWS